MSTEFDAWWAGVSNGLSEEGMCREAFVAGRASAAPKAEACKECGATMEASAHCPDGCEPPERCESGCAEPVTRHDSDNVPLCEACYQELKDAGPDAYEGADPVALASELVAPPGSTPVQAAAGPPRAHDFQWTLVEGPVLNDEDEGEYNPGGFWLGNQETNQVFILPEDMATVRGLLVAHPVAQVVARARAEAFAEAAKLCRERADQFYPLIGDEHRRTAVHLERLASVPSVTAVGPGKETP